MKRQLTLSNNNEIKIDLLSVSFPYTIIPWKRKRQWIYDIPRS